MICPIIMIKNLLYINNIPKEIKEYNIGSKRLNNYHVSLYVYVCSRLAEIKANLYTKQILCFKINGYE